MIKRFFNLFFIILLVLSLNLSNVYSLSDNIAVSTEDNFSDNSNRLNSYVVDNSYVLSLETKQQLIDALKQFEIDSNGVQIVVYIEDYIPNNSTLEERSLNIAEVNKIGQEKNDDGILLYLATKDRQFRWEVGYGLEPTLNSAWLGRMSREYMIPKFANEDFEAGIIAGLIEVEKKILNLNNSTTLNDTNYTNTDDTFSNDSTIFKLLAFLLIVMMLLNNPFVLIIIIFIIFYIIKLINRKNNVKNVNDSNFITAASNIFFGGRGGSGGSFGGGGFSGGGGHFGGGGFSGRF
ncbi:MAG: TPM domain-containing protein [Candidatus Woesearchaeota archaeon]